MEQFIRYKRFVKEIINLKDKDIVNKIEKFLDVELSNKNVPHLNKSKN